MYHIPKRHRAGPGSPEGPLRRARADQHRPGGIPPNRTPVPPGYPGYNPPGPDPIALVLAADRKHASREAWLGLVLASGMVALLVQGWLIPALGVAHVLAPVIALALVLTECLGSSRDRLRKA
jgi:hypothetical protein